MNLMDDGFSLVWIVSGWLVFLSALVWSLKTAPWGRVKNDSGAQHVFLGATVLVFSVWILSATIEGGLSFHFLLMTLMVLMFGPQFAFILAALALMGITLLGKAGVLVFGLNGALMGLVPVLITWTIVHFAYRYLERNFFVFVLLNGFFAAALSAFMVLMLGGLAMLWGDVHTLEKLTQSYFPYIPMLAVPEGFITGMMVGALILLKPNWIGCFSDELYLKGK